MLSWYDLSHLLNFLILGFFLSVVSSVSPLFQLIVVSPLFNFLIIKNFYVKMSLRKKVAFVFTFRYLLHALHAACPIYKQASHFLSTTTQLSITCFIYLQFKSFIKHVPKHALSRFLGVWRVILLNYLQFPPVMSNFFVTILKYVLWTFPFKGKWYLFLDILEKY